jgi:hypothetical protein
MNRSVPPLAALALLAASSMAQQNLSSRLMPITAPIRHAGVYHVATGTWTRNATFANIAGPDSIYNNTCSGIYFGAMNSGEEWQHRSRIPSPSGPTTPSIFYGASRNDEAPGCLTSYTINGFQVAYCSRLVGGGITWDHKFANSYTVCGSADMVPNYTFTITGLPGGTATGTLQCWILDVDTSATTPAFVLSADGDGTWTGPSTSEQFGWGNGPTAPAFTTAAGTGPIIAGNYSWMGGSSHPFTPCTGTDGTIWDAPINLAEEGTGMSTSDFFRITGPTPQVAPGCYYFGSIPLPDFHLKLFANTGCPTASPMADFCLPGQNGVISCPCNNPPVGTGMGCNNFGGWPNDSCLLYATGIASLAADSLTFTSTGENSTSLTIFLQGTASISTGVLYGAGVRCVSGILKRLYTGVASSGWISRPGVPDPDVHTRSAALGDPIGPGQTRYYMTYYRDPAAASPCGHKASTFNDSQAGSLVWSP